MLAAAMAFNIFAIGGLLPSLERIHMSTAISKVIDQMPARPPAIAAAGYHEPSLVFLLGLNINSTYISTVLCVFNCTHVFG